MLNIVLVEPQIPPNTGNIARLCAAMKCSLHLVRPLGFDTDDKTLKRAGLDYWPYVEVCYHDSLDQLQQQHPSARFFYYSTKVQNSYTSVNYQVGDFLVFGSETKGLDEQILKSNPQTSLTIPMPETQVRSLNLASSVSMVVGEALRQLNTLS